MPAWTYLASVSVYTITVVFLFVQQVIYLIRLFWSSQCHLLLSFIYLGFVLPVLGVLRTKWTAVTCLWSSPLTSCTVQRGLRRWTLPLRRSSSCRPPWCTASYRMRGTSVCYGPQIPFCGLSTLGLSPPSSLRETPRKLVWRGFWSCLQFTLIWPEENFALCSEGNCCLILH